MKVLKALGYGIGFAFLLILGLLCALFIGDGTILFDLFSKNK